MSNKLGNISFVERGGQDFLGGYQVKPYSDNTAKMIDDEVKAIIDEAYERTKNLLIEKRDKLEALTTRLMEKEVLDKNEIEEILGMKIVNNNGHIEKSEITI